VGRHGKIGAARLIPFEESKYRHVTEMHGLHNLGLLVLGGRSLDLGLVYDLVPEIGNCLRIPSLGDVKILHQLAENLFEGTTGLQHVLRKIMARELRECSRRAGPES